MELSLMITPANLVAALLTLIPFLGAAFFAPGLAGGARRLPLRVQLLIPAALSAPYALVALGGGVFRWGWLALYALLPVAIACLLEQARRADSSPGGQRGNWRDYLVLATLGLAVDLRWFEGAWPAHLAIFNKMLLLDAGIYGFLAVRQLDGVGFDLRLSLRDAGIGLRELACYAPIALALGLGLGFLHLHLGWPGSPATGLGRWGVWPGSPATGLGRWGVWPGSPATGLGRWGVWPGLAAIAGAWVFTFFFIAVPEEVFFRGWLQNLLERRIGRAPALFLTAALFGLSHFNKRTALFNWRYVLLAAVAGVFYGRAWRQERRVAASAITHASADAIWSLWLR
jgi:membrane protease YdiL (CAAX protease family)